VPDIVATAVLLLLQVPPGVPSASGIVSPVHKEPLPVIALTGLTVIVLVTLQPLIEYVTMAVPEPMPVTTPVLSPIVATGNGASDQVPPPTASLKVIVDPWHTLAGPLIAAGDGLTVTVTVVTQPNV
jgi:hypothetical protein